MVDKNDAPEGYVAKEIKSWKGFTCQDCCDLHDDYFKCVTSSCDSSKREDGCDVVFEKILPM